MKETKLWIRVSETEKAALAELAKSRELTISELVRLMAGRELSDEQKCNNRLLQLVKEKREGKDSEI